MNEKPFSYHVFLFPFKWELKSRKHLSFIHRTSIKELTPRKLSFWENISTPRTNAYRRELYNEKNFFYGFTHNVLYDSGSTENVIRHYERAEVYTQNVAYLIHVKAQKEDSYTLRVKSIGLNLYDTGVGVLAFYLENDQYADFNDVLRINQFGRRIYPPFIDPSDGVIGTKRVELAESISITGLNGEDFNYFEDFSEYDSESFGQPARFIKSLISDFSDDIKPSSVVDDRMFVVCWYKNEELSNVVAQDFARFKADDRWYKFLFVDGEDPTCQNKELRTDLIDKHSYMRWQEQGTVYGCSRYSLVMIAKNEAPPFLFVNMRTMYTRIVELSLVQRASILKFSDEISKISHDGKDRGDFAGHISDLYIKYIAFINKMHFREVTAQEQGIELYDKLQNMMRIEEQAKGLDSEISELHSYLSIIEDKGRNVNIELLTIISSVIIIPTLIIAFFEMKKKTTWLPVCFLIFSALTVYSIKYIRNGKNKLIFICFIFIAVFVLLFYVSLFNSYE